jgi:two-component system NtrC family sensor kinase
METEREEIKVLFVDDEENILNAMRRAFHDENYTILIALSGIEGLKILEREHIQLVISDYRMPTMNGVEFLAEVCKRWPHTVRIVISGYADVSSIVDAINNGQIYKFIPKPWNVDELKAIIANSIEQYLLLKKKEEFVDKLITKNEELLIANQDLKRQLDENAHKDILGRNAADIGTPDERK